MSLALKYPPHNTVEEWRHWEGRWELIEGMPYNMSPAPSKRHQQINLELAIILKREIKNCKNCEVLLPIDWEIADDTVVQPDLTIVCNDTNKKKLSKIPELVVEILSPSTRKKDLDLKSILYKEAGVGFYLIADPESDSILLFDYFDKKNTLHQKPKKLTGNRINISLPSGCKLTADLNLIFNT
ncbi:MAG: Uma2 family endonuclease [Saprospiraceae bacterium]